MTGTSMASPYVTGVVGLMLAANAKLTAAQCVGILQRTARPLPGASYEWGNDAGFGRIDPVAAIEEAARSNERDRRRERGGHEARRSSSPTRVIACCSKATTARSSCCDGGMAREHEGACARRARASCATAGGRAGLRLRLAYRQRPYLRRPAAARGRAGMAAVRLSTPTTGRRSRSAEASAAAGDRRHLAQRVSRQIGKQRMEDRGFAGGGRAVAAGDGVPESRDLAREMQKSGFVDSRGDQGLAASLAASCSIFPINKSPGAHGPAKLLMFRAGQIRSMSGRWRSRSSARPQRTDTAAKGWNNFLNARPTRQARQDLRAEIKRKVDAFGSEAFDLRDWNGIPDFKGVTTPNIASLMFMVEEGGKTPAADRRFAAGHHPQGTRADRLPRRPGICMLTCSRSSIMAPSTMSTRTSRDRFGRQLCVLRQRLERQSGAGPSSR